MYFGRSCYGPCTVYKKVERIQKNYILPYLGWMELEFCLKREGEYPKSTFNIRRNLRYSLIKIIKILWFKIWKLVPVLRNLYRFLVNRGSDHLFDLLYEKSNCSFLPSLLSSFCLLTGFMTKRTH